MKKYKILYRIIVELIIIWFLFEWNNNYIIKGIEAALGKVKVLPIVVKLLSILKFISPYGRTLTNDLGFLYWFNICTGIVFFCFCIFLILAFGDGFEHFAFRLVILLLLNLATEDGYEKYTCTRCNDSYQKKIDKTGHRYILSKTVKATCTADGYKEYKCEGCGDTYRTDMSKTGHDYVKKIVDATCTEDGYEKYTCTRCNDSYQIKIDKTGHRYILSKTVKATCTADGYKEYKCEGCGDTYRDAISKVEHDYTILVDHKDSTCKEQGYDIYQCKNCNETKTINLELDTENHTLELTGSDLEYKYYKCKGCGLETKEYNDQEYTIDLGNGKTTTVIGHYNLTMPSEILTLLNARRAIFDCNPVILATDDSALGEAARIRACEISYLYSHTRPNGERAIISLYSFAKTEGENLAKGDESSESVMQGWIDSNSHDDNMTEFRWKKVGIAVFARKYGDHYVNSFVQLFTSSTN